ncbi:hypothetical protein LSEI_1334 [Lacticaseibacillus paracasei ATCC 334]|uniref:Uncharacterized protein n=2 Tax=Lacticaseibacillus paracasei TaxID=1597 RepID=Q039K7_LACP3|nr:hypothetical protein LSEI_1334 [Lacticaseibacillus paracasei ATCC 334]
MTAPSLLVQVNDCRYFNPVEDAHVGRIKPVRVQGLKATQWAPGQPVSQLGINHMILAATYPVAAIFMTNKGNFDIMVWYSKDGQCRIVLGHLLITSLAFGFDANKHSMDTE